MYPSIRVLIDAMGKWQMLPSYLKHVECLFKIGRFADLLSLPVSDSSILWIKAVAKRKVTILGQDLAWMGMRVITYKIRRRA